VGSFTQILGSDYFRRMSPRGTKQTVATHRTEPRAYSPDDIKARLIEAAKRERLDSRTEAQRWLGDPPPDRSALAEYRARQAAQPASGYGAAAPSVPRASWTK
jgi:hypothetical protein